MEWPVLGPQVIGRVTSHPESFLVSHAYLSIWIVDPDSLGREDESAWDSTGGRAIQIPEHSWGVVHHEDCFNSEITSPRTPCRAQRGWFLMGLSHKPRSPIR